MTRTLLPIIPVLLGLLLLLGSSGCAHRYYYVPEISGEGARVGRGGIVYEIPPGSPQIKMKLASLGVVKPPKDSNAPANAHLLQIRMYFKRVTGAPQATASTLDVGGESLNPSELSITLSNGHEIKPVLIHAAYREGGLIRLATTTKQVIELFFPLPSGVQEAGDIQSFHFRWTLHYDSEKSETRTARFDRGDAAPEQGAEMFPWDPDYPFDESPVLPPGWEMVPWYWWEPFPGGPWWW
jgi:hypothetical protein